MNDYEKIFEHFKLLRPFNITQKFIDELDEKEKYSLARYVRTWGYINSLSLEIAKDLKLDTENQSTLLNSSILIQHLNQRQQSTKNKTRSTKKGMPLNYKLKVGMIHVLYLGLFQL